MSATPPVAALLEPILADAIAGANQPAVCARDSSITYAQLRGDVFAVRDWLLRNGVAAGERVAVCLPKEIATVEIILGIMAAGAAYVPLNHRLPTIQLRRIIDDLQPSLLIAGRELAQALGGETGHPGGMGLATTGKSGPALGLDLLGTLSGARPKELAPANDLATLLYTSGSTGDPKGIMLTHRNVASFVEWAANTFEVSSSDRVLSHAPLHFDLSLFDIFCTLTRHGTVHLVDEMMARFAGAVRGLIESAGISVWYSVPTALMQLQERRALEGIRSLRLVAFAGEVFPVPILRQLMDDVPAAEFVNLFGPTETNVCTYYRLPGPPASDLEPLPIGRPCEHLEVDLLDPAGSPVRMGETGEICVSGPAVMRGYWQQEALTRATKLAGRVDSYRTGDYAYQRGDGILMFVGRRDQQVKVRGHRVELLALEATLNAHPDVRESAAMLVADERVGGTLMVFAVPRREPVALADICGFIGTRLAPSYRPDRIEWLSDMPRTVTGKCDRTALLALARPKGSS
jgi:amino acid adenylation domain-containing protein